MADERGGTERREAPASDEGAAVLAAGVGRMIDDGTNAFRPPLAWERI